MDLVRCAVFPQDWMDGRWMRAPLAYVCLWWCHLKPVPVPDAHTPPRTDTQTTTSPRFRSGSW